LMGFHFLLGTGTPMKRPATELVTFTRNPFVIYVAT